jgi:hypothetical protein
VTFILPLEGEKWNWFSERESGSPNVVSIC